MLLCNYYEIETLASFLYYKLCSLTSVQRLLSYVALILKK